MRGESFAKKLQKGRKKEKEGLMKTAIALGRRELESSDKRQAHCKKEKGKRKKKGGFCGRAAHQSPSSECQRNDAVFWEGKHYV